MAHYPRHLTAEERLNATLDPYGMGKKTTDNRNNRQTQRAKAKAIAEANALAEAQAKAANQSNTSTTGRGVRNTELAAKNKKIVNEVIAKVVDNRNPGTRRKDNRELNQLSFNDYQKEMELIDWEKRQNYVQTRRGMRPPRQGILPVVPNTPNLIDIARNPDYAIGQEDAPVNTEIRRAEPAAPSVPIHPVTGLRIEKGDNWNSYTDAPSGTTFNNENFNWNNENFKTPTGNVDGLSQQEIDVLYGRTPSPVQPKQEVDFSSIANFFRNLGK